MTGETSDRQRGMMYQVAEAIAPTWVRRRAFIESVSAPARTWILGQVDAQPGQVVLEVAAGVGDTGLEAAASVGEQGRLISTDLSPTMVEAARQRGAELGLTNVEHRVADAAETGLDDDSVDAVVCRFGYMLMPDPAAALAEARRVLRPGGRLAMAVWAAPERNPFFSVIGRVLVERGLFPPPDPKGPGIFALADPARLTALLEAAGFTSVRTEEVPMRFLVRDAEEYVAVVADTAGPLGLTLQGLAEAERRALVEQVRSVIQRFATDDGYAIPGAAGCALAS